MKNQHPVSTVVVMESGSEWPAWLNRLEQGATKRAIAQQDDESPSELADRVLSKMDELAERGDVPSIAVIACNERVDASAGRARCTTARALLSVMAARREGRLLFTASQRQSGGSRHALSALATDLSHEWAEANVTVCVRFGQASRPQEVRRVA